MSGVYEVVLFSSLLAPVAWRTWGEFVEWSQRHNSIEAALRSNKSEWALLFDETLPSILSRPVITRSAAREEWTRAIRLLRTEEQFDRLAICAIHPDKTVAIEAIQALQNAPQQHKVWVRRRLRRSFPPHRVKKAAYRFL